MANGVIIKGIADGLLVQLPELPAAEALAALKEHLEQNRAFFEGCNCSVYLMGDLDEESLDAFRAALREGFGLDKVEGVPKRDVPERQRKAEGQFGALKSREGYALTIEGTVRNGQRVMYQGDLVVIGDVNPGSQLVAGGNVLVCGALRGTVHAGALGNSEASITAFTLLPTQIRIGQHIARPPENMKKPDYPEMARVRDGRIEIVPYLPARAQMGGFR